MTRLERHHQIVAILLAALAGYVDAVAFIASGGYFVSFMSGNSTRLGVALASAQVIGTLAAIIAGFIGGVSLATLIGIHRRDRPARHLRRQRMALVGVLLAIAAFSAARLPPTASFALAAAAMGAVNAVFADDGDALALTYMTGALVKIGQGVAEALAGGRPFGWLPFLLLWAGLIAGGTAGAFAHGSYALGALWPAAVAALLLMPFVGSPGSRPSPEGKPGL